MNRESIGLMMFRSPAIALLKAGTYPCATAAAREMDVDVLLDSLDQLDAFCCANGARYEQASVLQYEQGACLSPDQWWWWSDLV